MRGSLPSPSPICQRANCHIMHSLYHAQPLCQGPGRTTLGPSRPYRFSARTDPHSRHGQNPRHLIFQRASGRVGPRPDSNTSRRSALRRRLDLHSVADRPLPVKELERKELRPPPRPSEPASGQAAQGHAPRRRLSGPSARVPCRAGALEPAGCHSAPWPLVGENEGVMGASVY